MTVINTNIGALNARHYSAKAELFVNKALERLSSGRRINSASDDAAGLAVASKMTSQVLGMKIKILLLDQMLMVCCLRYLTFLQALSLSVKMY